MAGIGPLTQLAAVGPQDAILPRAPYPQSSWKRHTRFALNTSEARFPSGLDFGQNGRVLIPPSIDDMLTALFLEVTLPAIGAGWSWKADVGYRLIANYRVTLGDLNVVAVDGTFHRIVDRLHTRCGQAKNLNSLVGAEPLQADTEHHLIIPLRILTNPSEPCKLPLIAMTSSRTQIDVSLNGLEDVVSGPEGENPPANTSLTTCQLMLQTATLETTERFSFIGSSYTMLMESVLWQDFPVTMTTNNHDVVPLAQLSVDLSFMRNSVKQIVFVFLTDEDCVVEDFLTSCTLYVNNQQQFATRTGSYFGFPSSYRTCLTCASPATYSLNFAIKSTSTMQPNGCLDMSQINTCTLSLGIAGTALQVQPAKLRVFSLSYRALHFQNNTVNDA